MSATTLAAFVSVVAGYVTGIWFVVGRLDRRIERVEERVDARLTAFDARLARIEEKLDVVAAIAQRLEDHITNHPGPERLVR